METNFIDTRRYIDFRTDQEEHDAEILAALLKKSFLSSKITIHWGSKIEICEPDMISYLVIADNLVFRSPKNVDHGTPKQKCIQAMLESVIDFFRKFKKKKDTLGWYLPEDPRIFSPKNRELFPYFGDFQLNDERLFYQAFPPGYTFDNMTRGNWNYVLFKNIVSIEKLKSCLIRRVEFNEWIYKMVIIFKGNFMMGDYYVNQNEGVGFHLLEMCLKN